jgi:hypothetical protein
MICAAVAAYGFFSFIKGISKSVSNTSIATGLTPRELKTIEYAEQYHTLLEELLQRVVTIEQLSKETPAPFSDHSWQRLLEMCDDLEGFRGELNGLMASKDQVSAIALGRFLCGISAEVPEVTLSNPKLQARQILFWQRQTNELMLRMVSKLADSARYGTGGNTRPLSQQYLETLEAIKDELNQAL